MRNMPTKEGNANHHPFRRLKLDATLLGGFKDSSSDVNQSMDLSEWTQAKDLKSGDLTFTADGKLLAISSIEVDDREETVYNFEVEEYHTYFVGEVGVWVHNDAGYSIPDITNLSFKDISEIQDRYSGITGLLRGTSEKIKNAILNQSWSKDFEVKSSESGFDENLSPAEREVILKNLNKLSTSIQFVEDENGKLIMIKQGNIQENHKEAERLLSNVFGDDNHKVIFVNPNDILSGSGSGHLRGTELWRQGKLEIINRFGAKNPYLEKDYSLDANLERSSFIFLDQKDSGKMVTERNASGELVHGQHTLEMVLGHELIHADRFRQGANQQDSRNSKVNATIYATNGRVGYMPISAEEVETVGRGISLHQNYTFQNSGQFVTENSLRVERGMNVRASYLSPNKKRKPNEVKWQDQ
jgi:hypothetical protein